MLFLNFPWPTEMILLYSSYSREKYSASVFFLLIFVPLFSPTYPFSLIICAIGGEMNVQQNQPVWLASEVLNIYFLLYFMPEHAWSQLSAAKPILHSPHGDGAPTSSLRGNLQRDIVFAHSHCDRCFISSTSTCWRICKRLPTLCSQLWK